VECQITLFNQNKHFMKHLNIIFKGLAVTIIFTTLLCSCGSAKQGFKDGWNSKKEGKK
jgi:hypothetical protein